MKNFFLFLLFSVLSFVGFSQQTKVYGVVTSEDDQQPLPFVKILFADTKIGVVTEIDGSFVLESYYATDSIEIYTSGYKTLRLAIKKDQVQEINVVLQVDDSQSTELEEFVFRAPDENPALAILRKVIAHKPVNNKEKLLSYQYEMYNKMQLDINNIGEKTMDLGPLKKMDVVFDYLDSMENGKSYLPVLLSETVSDYYYRNNPKKKREVIAATKISGIENLKVNEMLGDMYLDFNIYDNYISIFRRDFISPVANFSKSFYKFYLYDSAFIDNQWCYQIRFVPKRNGDMTFEGEMWIHDTTYAVKSFEAKISPWANINFVNDLYFKQDFQQVKKEVWMMTNELLLVDLKLTQQSKLYGFYARKFTSRKNFVINEPETDEFYNADNTVEVSDGATERSAEYWEIHRHAGLSFQEEGINEMIDSLNRTPFFRVMKNLGYTAATGYYPVNKLEFGNIFNFISFNPVEALRVGVGVRTSNKFSKRLELGGKLTYGTRDQEFKYGGSIRYNITPRKRGMLTLFYSKDIEQIGQSPTAAAVGSTFNTLFRTGPLDKLTFVEKIGINLEKDVKKDLILYGGFEWKEYTALGKANYMKPNALGGLDEIGKIQTAEFIARVRWTKDEEFISGAFDRTTLRSRYPVFSLQGIFGVKGLMGSDYNYQKVEFQMEHIRQVGYLGTLRYGLTAGYTFGTVAYPFLKVHEGNQSYWLLTSTFNMLNYFEFVSDRYVNVFIEQHWAGLFFDRLPLVQKMKLRLVTTGRMTYGAISERHLREMVLPEFTRSFGDTPYAEAAVGVENILKFIRVDLVWRLSHLDPGMSPLGVRARWSFSF